MAVFKFLFVLALAVPLAVFMWNYINKLSDEFQESVAKGKGSDTAQKPAAPAPEKRKRKPKKKPAASAKAPAREQRQSYGSSRRQAQENGYGAHDVRQAGSGPGKMPENYENLRSNFEHSKMKQRYEESLREGNESQRTQKPRKKAAKAVRSGSPDAAARQSAKPESKRKRRKARKKERELRNRETRR